MFSGDRGRKAGDDRGKEGKTEQKKKSEKKKESKEKLFKIFYI